MPLTDSQRMALAQRGLRALMSEFRSLGVERIGTEATEETLFCLATLARIDSLLNLLGQDPPIERADEDRKLAGEFRARTAWSEFHLHGLFVILLGRPRPVMSAEILQEIMDGARVVVMAFAAAREAVRLRGLIPSRDFSDSDWDEEDETLVQSSTREAETLIPRGY